MGGVVVVKVHRRVRRTYILDIFNAELLRKPARLRRILGRLARQVNVRRAHILERLVEVILVDEPTRLRRVLRWLARQVDVLITGDEDAKLTGQLIERRTLAHEPRLSACSRKAARGQIAGVQAGCGQWGHSLGGLAQSCMRGCAVE